MKDKPYEVPNGIECPRCKEKITEAQDVVGHEGAHFRKGKILVCATCTLICQVGDSKLIPLSMDQIKSLPKILQSQLLMVCKELAKRTAASN
jgi:hypothetical protein